MALMALIPSVSAVIFLTIALIAILIIPLLIDGQVVVHHVVKLRGFFNQPVPIRPFTGAFSCVGPDPFCLTAVFLLIVGPLRASLSSHIRSRSLGIMRLTAPAPDPDRSCLIPSPTSLPTWRQCCRVRQLLSSTILITRA
ncbi:uncharacterized protein F4822DRAFT_206476 [Hypoxylon trugodes]|uniref:uncharacterized protein n=1 Tax=Hypoxylon trugodes TaxID=326681 RepID=UPI00219BDF56|nr:uncharacterized protein F4822DRAFT_206476 [Hypoxylon trugodes]KAI1389625.1 hypothetical protein F4822DRAFT_206476 [Hypoxylon trugodes]